MKNALEQFLEEGWAVVDLENTTALCETRAQLEKKLKTLLGKETSLEEYHRAELDDEQHTALQSEITQYFRDAHLGPRVIAEQLSLFQKWLGPDLSVQRHPYLRITRPRKPQDNIGYHRDTFYGGSPYELSVLVPFVDLPAESSLSVLPGSHVHPEKLYPTHQMQNADTSVTKGSAKHQLGFLYAPKVMDPKVEENMKPIPLKLGQALIFSLAIVHGSIENKGSITRWSSDIRVMPSFAPVDLSARPTYYEPLSSSMLTRTVREYERNNREAS